MVPVWEGALESAVVGRREGGRREGGRREGGRRGAARGAPAGAAAEATH